MSRKRKQSKRAAPAAAPAAVPTLGEAVPDEILAEGSGPVEPASAAELAEAANAVGRCRRKRRGPEPEAEASTGAEAAGQSDQVSDEGEPGGEDGEVAGATAEVAGAAAEAGFEASAEEAAASAAEEEAAGAEGDAAPGSEGGALAEEACAAEAAEMAEALAEMAVGDGAAGAEPARDAADGEVTDGEADGAELGAVLPTSAASMDAVQLKHLVEALVFASDKPLTIARLRQLTRVSDIKRLEQVLEAIAEDFAESGIVLQQVSGGYQFRTRTQFSGWVQQLIAGRPVRLSRAQLETLAIIAYRQPITRPEIDEIRGVDSSATLKLLIDRALIRILGKKEEVGRPMLYGTTKEFLDFFSLGDLRELPTLREYSELTDESRQVMSARLGIELDETARGAGEGEPGAEGAEDAEGAAGPGAEGVNGERHRAAEVLEGKAAEAEAVEHEAAAIEAAEGEVAEGEAAEEIEAAGGEAAENLDLDPNLGPDMGPDIASHVGAIVVEGQLDAEGAVEPAPE